MRRISLLAVIATSFVCARICHAHPVLDAARGADSLVMWIEKSMVSADFSCQGKIEYAILGIRPTETIEINGLPITETNPSIVVAIFPKNINTKPQIFNYSNFAIENISLTIESLDVKPMELAQMNGFTPEGLARSKKCKGLRLSDGEHDAVHIYWNKVRKEFADWSL